MFWMRDGNWEHIPAQGGSFEDREHVRFDALDDILGGDGNLLLAGAVVVLTAFGGPIPLGQGTSQSKTEGVGQTPIEIPRSVTRWPTTETVQPG